MLLIKRDGNEMYIESTASPIRDGSGAVSRRRARVPRREREPRAEPQALVPREPRHPDGLVNRREFEARLERALRSAKARETAYALCHIDVDQFKIINDTCGHSAGDALLGQVGALLKTKIRWRDTLARLGGDEFGVLLESCSLEEALRMAEQLRETDPQLQVRLGGAHVPARLQRRRRADHRRQRGRRGAAVGRGQRLRARPRKRAATASTASRKTTST